MVFFPKDKWCGAVGITLRRHGSVVPPLKGWPSSPDPVEVLARRKPQTSSYLKWSLDWKPEDLWHFLLFCLFVCLFFWYRFLLMVISFQGQLMLSTGLLNLMAISVVGSIKSGTISFTGRPLFHAFFSRPAFFEITRPMFLWPWSHSHTGRTSHTASILLGTKWFQGEAEVLKKGLGFLCMPGSTWGGHLALCIFPSSFFTEKVVAGLACRTSKGKSFPSFLKAWVLYYQVNFLSVLFAWSESDILWPVRFMAACSCCLFSFPWMPRSINHSTITSCFVCGSYHAFWEMKPEEFLHAFMWHKILRDCFAMNPWQIQMAMYWLLFYESNAWL